MRHVRTLEAARAGPRSEWETEKKKMPDMKAKTKERLQHWQRRLADVLLRTHIESERRRLQRELAELSTVESEIDRLRPEQLERLYAHLERDPDAWVAHRMAS
jgi:uncharacterized protein Yka (UPF0111/DUF47 family)